MEVLFECSTRYRTSDRSERMSYQVEHAKRNSESTSNHELFYLLYKHTDDVSEDFPKISEHFPKISEDSPKQFRRPDKRFRTFPGIFQRLPKISEKNLMMFRPYIDSEFVSQFYLRF